MIVPNTALSWGQIFQHKFTHFKHSDWFKNRKPIKLLKTSRISNYAIIVLALSTSAYICPNLISELGGEFPIEELHTGEGGLLRVCMEGVRLLFAQRKVQPSP